jgi:hypothetical protein
MSRLFMVALLVLAAVVPDASADVNDSLTGNLYRGWSELAQVVYVGGFREGLLVAESLREGQPGMRLHRINACLLPMTNGQIHAIVGKLLSAYPRRWHEAMAILTMNAVSEACR